MSPPGFVFTQIYTYALIIEIKCCPSVLPRIMIHKEMARVTVGHRKYAMTSWKMYDLTADTDIERMTQNGRERLWKTFRNDKRNIFNFSDDRIQECSSVQTELTEVWQ